MTIDLDAMTINKSKFMADGNKYFELYRKHIPDNISGNILLLSIGNLDCISRIMSMNPNAKYLIIDRKTIIKSLTIVYKDIYDIEAIENDDTDLYNIIQELDMKFDCIVMNPPYQKNLHLKILAEAIKHLKDNNSICVNLSPVRWLQDPLAKYKQKSDYYKYENSISKHLKDIKIIDKLLAQTYFTNTVMGADLGIYVCDNYGGFDYTTLVNKFLVKVFEKQNTHIKFDINKNDGIRVRFPIICNNGGSGCGRKPSMANFGKMIWFENGKRDGKWWHEWYMHNQYTKITETIPYSAKFNSICEAQNFCNQFNTSFCKVYTHLIKSDVHVTPDIVLWLGDAINPRTGLKGYKSEWTNEDLYKYFNITPEERKIIEETMAKYETK